MLSTLLDPRTVNCNHLKDRKELVDRCFTLLSDEYVRFAMLYHATATKKKADQVAKVTADAAAVLAKITSNFSSTSSTPKDSGVTAESSKKSEQTVFSTTVFSDSSDEESASPDVVTNPAAVAKELAAATAKELLALKANFKTEFGRVFRAYRKAAQVIIMHACNP